MRLKRLTYLVFLLAAAAILCPLHGNGQAYTPAEISSPLRSVVRESGPSHQLFIENQGQFAEWERKYADMGKILFVYRGWGSPVFITSNGLIAVLEKKERLSKAEEEALERQGVPEELIERRYHETRSVVTMKWMQANPAVTASASGRTEHYFTYGQPAWKAHGYNEVVLNNLYPGIDLVYHFTPGRSPGFEYSFVVRPGAKPASIQMCLGGDVSSGKLDAKKAFAITAAAGAITHSAPVSFQSPEVNAAGAVKYKNNGTRVASFFTSHQNTLAFKTAAYDTGITLVIDPFISVSSGFSGTNDKIGREVDFDYQGNVYVVGGGEYAASQLSKFNAAGVLQWTFSGILQPPQPAWQFGNEYGGFAVEKSTGKCYIGQGFNTFEGTRIVRLNTAGFYDGFISDGEVAFKECWKILWNCSNGNPQILICGGSTQSNSNFAALSLPSTSITPVNITGIGNVTNQDIADAVVDPVTNEMYTIYATVQSGQLNNSIFKHSFPYSAATVQWQQPSGFGTLQEASNQPFLSSFFNSGNAINALAVNRNYLFYWDGDNLRAYNKVNGTAVGTGFTSGLPAKFQGGIYADECNNVFIGYANGVIKVLRFNGTAFDDAAVNDIVVTGFADKNVFDLAYNESERLLYACGNGFVAAFDVAAYCPGGTVYNLNVNLDCPSGTATAVLSPAAPAGAVVTYTLFNGTLAIATNSTGVFPGLSNNITYTIKVVINQACSGIPVQPVDFSFAPCYAVAIQVQNAVCGASNGSLTATANFGFAPYSYSLNGGVFGPSNIFSGLAPGNYAVTVKDGGGIEKTGNAVIVNTVPNFLFSTVIDTAFCGAANGAITVLASGGTGPYRYSFNGGAFQNNNSFAGLAGGNYTINTLDANNCPAGLTVTVPVIAPPVISTNIFDATCGLNNGGIEVMVAGGSAPYSYSLDGVTFQSGNIFDQLASGNYNITVRDNKNCPAAAAAFVKNTPPLVSSFTAADASCNNNDGVITVTATGGTPPYEFTLNGGQPQNNGVFTGLATGVYEVLIEDLSNCSNTNTITVGLNNTITVTAGPGGEICTGDSVLLAAVASGAVSYNWLPATGLSNAQVLQPAASPAATTLYTITAVKGPCTRTATATVTVNQRPVANAGADSVICFGASTRLNGSGGLFYQWTPAAGLSSSTVANPVVNLPPRSITYTLRVTDAKGCVSAAADAVTVTVLPPARLFAGNDTTIVAGQALQLLAQDVNNSGFTQYTWQPGTGLNNAFVFNPVALLNNSITYRVVAATPAGCVGNDEVNVKVFKAPEIYVPGIFTPNNDGINDIVFAVPAGIQSFRFFRIYNRWGQLVFSTANAATGWNGRLSGVQQNSGSFVWVAEAVDFKGNPFRRKGTLTLVR
jgi:gliding motility-associated-like protein